MTLAETAFWVSALGVLYPYLGYPLVLGAVGRLFGRAEQTPADADLPTVTLIIPVHNEGRRIERKMANTAALDYLTDRLQVLVVSDGSTDDTVEKVRRLATPATTVVELRERGGKAAALNAGLRHATNEIVVFSDASIELRSDALRTIVRRFQESEIGCVSGEDRIAGAGGEAWYGRYELSLRRLESRVHSIVGASGSFYAQRRALCAPFTEGMAPDFLSVLRTVEQGFRAVSDASAVGTMVAVKDARDEFERKVRTLLRGMTTLFAHAAVLNPLRFPLFSFAIWSHKLLRWLAPAFMILTLVTPLALLSSPFYLMAFVGQALFYFTGLVALVGWDAIRQSLPGKIALYFTVANGAVLVAWWRYCSGVRQELWTPSQR